MPIIKSAKKKVRVDKRRTSSNLRARHAVEKMISLFKKTPSQENLNKVFSVLDKAAKKGIIHKNKASRFKAKFRVKALPDKESQKTASRRRVKRAEKA
jgi:small subunit ribosomal protein S20